MEVTLVQQNGAVTVPVSFLRLQTGLSAAGILEWESPCREVSPQNGDMVRLGDAFQGYVFRSEDTRRSKRAVCYDQVKYLLYRDTREFTGKTAAEILWEIIRERELAAGEIAETGVALPSYLCENRTLLAMVQGALEETRKASGREYVLFDRCGALCLQNVENTAAGVLLCGENQIASYRQSADIDGDTYTRFKLLQEDRRSGFRRVTEAENAENRKKWGVLQYFERVDHSWNAAQVNARLESLRKSCGGERRTLEMEGLGDMACLAGRTVLCRLPEETAERRYLIEESVISGQGDALRMRLKLREV